MRLIDADVLIAEICQDQCERKYCDCDYTCSEVAPVVNAPTVDAAPVKHGHWEDVGSLSCRCSECGCKHDRETRFCPNCGAKMDLEGLDEKQT